MLNSETENNRRLFKIKYTEQVHYKEKVKKASINLHYNFIFIHNILLGTRFESSKSCVCCLSADNFVIKFDINMTDLAIIGASPGTGTSP